VCLVPGAVSDVRVIAVTSTSVSVSWSPLSCDRHNGPALGYAYRLTRTHTLDDETTGGNVGTSDDIVVTSRDVGTSDDELGTSHDAVTNETEVQLSGLHPFSGYTFTMSFRNSDFDGPTTTINFTTHEDGWFHSRVSY